MMFLSSKYATVTLLLLLTLASLQQLVFAQTPAPPFDNTPGIQVQAPANGLSVCPDGAIPFAFTIGRRAISSLVVTMAKADGSGNTTIVDYKAVTSLRLTMRASLASFKLPEGDYILNMVITPSTTVVVPEYTSLSSSSGAPQKPAPTAAPPSSLPGIYYWRTNIRISNDAPVSGNAGASGSGENGSGGGASNNAVVTGVTGMTGVWTTFTNMMTALTVLAFVNVVVL